MDAIAGRRCGYTNAALLTAMAVLLCIALLTQIGSGNVSLDALLSSTAPAATSSKSKKTKPLQMIPSAPRPVSVVTVSEPAAAAPDGTRSSIELRQAIVRMDSKAAAEMLFELDTPTIVELLIGQRERDLARILEEADPIFAAQWVAALFAESELRRIAREPVAQNQQPAVVPDGDTSPEAPAESTGAQGSTPENGETPPSEETSGDVANVPGENGSSGTGTAFPLSPGTNIA